VSERFADVAVRLAGFAGLWFGWSPDTFWQATPAELAGLANAAGGDAGTAPPDAGTLARLMEAFPDG
jgi:uncharacterized phage protein (TIGR02216 family)